MGGRARPHLEVSVDDGRLALVQAGHGLTRVTEDVEDLGLAEAHGQPLVHLLHHLACCRAERGKVSVGVLLLPGFSPGFTFTVLHEDQDLPHAVRHHVDGGIQIVHDVFMTRQLFLHHGMDKRGGGTEGATLQLNTQINGWNHLSVPL